MASSTTDLRVRISAELGDIRAGLASLRRELQTVRTQATQAMPDGNAFANGIRTAHNELRAFAATFVSLAGARMLAGIADEAAMLRGRLKEAKGDYEAILALAQRSRTGLATTVDLYTRMERATRAQGLSQQRLLGITESVNQAIKLSFQGVAQGEAAVLQLGQALASGRLGGDELASLAETAPRLTQAIADGLGVPIAKLKELGKEGELTSAKVIGALEKQAAVLESEYARVPLTISDSMTQVRNAFVDFIGQQDDAAGASRGVASALKLLAENLTAVIEGLLRFGAASLAIYAFLKVVPLVQAAMAAMAARVAASALATAVAVETMSARGSAALLTLAGTAEASAARTSLAMRSVVAVLGAIAAAFAGWQIGSYLREQFLQVELAGIALAQGLGETWERVKFGATAAAGAIKAVFVGAFNTVREGYARTLNGLGEVAGRLGFDSLAGKAREAAAAVAPVTSAWDDYRLALGQASADSDAAIARLRQGYGELADAAIEARLKQAAADGLNGAGSGAGGDGGSGKASPYRMDLQLARDSTDRQLAELDRLYAAGLVKVSEYFARKRALQEQANAQDLEQAQHELKVASSQTEQAKALAEIIKLQRDRAEIGPAVVREQADAEKNLEAQLQGVRDRIAAMNGDTVGVARRQLEAEFRGLLRRLETEGRQAEVAMVRGFINSSVVQQEVDKFQTDAQRILADLRAAETSIASQTDAGMLGTAEGERQMQTLRAKSIEQLRVQRQGLVALLNTLKPGSPEFEAARAGIQQLDGDLAGVEASQRKFAQQIEDNLAQGLNGFFTDMANGAKSAKDAFADLVQSFIQGVAQMIAQKMALNAAESIMGAVLHQGGVVGSGGTSRAVNPLWFGSAPRYHTGGIAGLRPNEVPAVLEVGEEVLRRDNPRHIANGGGRGGNVQVVVNNNSGQQASVTESMQGGTRRIQVDIGQMAVNAVAADIANGGRSAAAIQRQFGVSPKGVPLG